MQSSGRLLVPVSNFVALLNADLPNTLVSFCHLDLGCICMGHVFRKKVPRKWQPVISKLCDILPWYKYCL